MRVSESSDRSGDGVSATDRHPHRGRPAKPEGGPAGGACGGAVAAPAGAAPSSPVALGQARVSASTAPHYLLLSHEESPRLGNLLKVNPSIKAPADSAGILAGLTVHHAYVAFDATAGLQLLATSPAVAVVMQ